MRKHCDKVLVGIIGVLLVAVMFLTIGIVGQIESTYKRDAIVTDVNGTVVTLECGAGYEWEWIGTGLRKGEEVTLVMGTNHTDMDITDDFIMDIMKK